MRNCRISCHEFIQYSLLCFYFSFMVLLIHVFRAKIYQTLLAYIIIDRTIVDVGDIRVIPHLLMDKYLNEKTIDGCQNALYGESNELPVSPLSITMDFCEEFYKEFTDKGLVSLGGDHSVSFPLTKAYLQKRKEQGKKVAIIHFDAHTDLLDQRLGIDICFGSWAYHIIEDLMEPELLYQIGIRSSGKDEEYWEDKFSVQQDWANEVMQKGAAKVDVVYPINVAISCGS